MNVDSYINSLPKDIQPLLRKVRRTIRAAAPKATEQDAARALARKKKK